MPSTLSTFIYLAQDAASTAAATPTPEVVTIPAASTPWLVFFNYGILGAMVVLILLGFLYPKPHIDRLERENDRLRADIAAARADTAKALAENDRLRTATEEKIIPAIIRATDALDSYLRRDRAS